MIKSFKIMFKILPTELNLIASKWIIEQKIRNLTNLDLFFLYCTIIL